MTPSRILPRPHLPRVGRLYRYCQKTPIPQPKRTYVSSPKDKKIVLEKPEKFVPPSHPSRMVTGKGYIDSHASRHYGGELSQAEVKAQTRRDYPGLPPAHGTFGHNFMRNPNMHLFITLGVLGSLATYTLTERFMDNSPFSHLLPSPAEFLLHPIQGFHSISEVIILHSDYQTRVAMEQRRVKIEDITKRRKYRRAHDVEEETFVQKILPEGLLKDEERSMDKVFGEEEKAGKGGEGKEAGWVVSEKEEELGREKKKGWGRFPR